MQSLPLKGIVIKSTGSWYQVALPDGKVLQARVRGKMRLSGLDTSNPIAVGDEVTLEEDAHYADTAQISAVSTRRNYIIRKANKLSSRRQIIATNLDAAVLVASLMAPRTSLGFIDRFLICCEAFHIPAILFFNKTDLLNTPGLELLEEIMKIYSNAGYEVMSGSALDPESLNTFHTRIMGKTVMEAGHSGVGKSSILNAMYPDARAKVNSISTQHETGKHTTTFAEMHIMPDGTRFIDTPGIRDFGVVEVPVDEVRLYFPEFRKRMNDCKFNDCKHINEPECAIKSAVESGEISQERYHSYLSIFHGEDVFE